MSDKNKSDGLEKRPRFNRLLFAFFEAALIVRNLFPRSYTETSNFSLMLSCASAELKKGTRSINLSFLLPHKINLAMLGSQELTRRELKMLLHQPCRERKGGRKDKNKHQFKRDYFCSFPQYGCIKLAFKWQSKEHMIGG